MNILKQTALILPILIFISSTGLFAREYPQGPSTEETRQKTTLYVSEQGRTILGEQRIAMVLQRAGTNMPSGVRMEIRIISTESETEIVSYHISECVRKTFSINVPPYSTVISSSTQKIGDEEVVTIDANRNESSQWRYLRAKSDGKTVAFHESGTASKSSEIASLPQ